MIKSGQSLQDALFTHLDRDKNLVASFAPMVAAPRAAPYFSFDALTSHMRDEALGLVEHELAFSVWSSPQAPKDAADLTARLLAHFANFTALPANSEHRLIRFAAAQLQAQADAPARAWRTTLRFTALTQTTQGERA